MRKKERELPKIEIPLGTSDQKHPTLYELGVLFTDKKKERIFKSVKTLILGPNGEVLPAISMWEAEPACQFHKTACFIIKPGYLVVNIEMAKIKNDYEANIVIHRVESINEDYWYCTIVKEYDSDSSNGITEEFNLIVDAAMDCCRNAQQVYTPQLYDPETSWHMDEIGHLDWSKYCQDEITSFYFKNENAFKVIEPKSDFEFETTISETTNTEPEPEPATTFIGSIQNFLGHMVY